MEGVIEAIFSGLAMYQFLGWLRRRQSCWEAVVWGAATLATVAVDLGVYGEITVLPLVAAGALLAVWHHYRPRHRRQVQWVAVALILASDVWPGAGPVSLGVAFVRGFEAGLRR